MTTPEIPQAPVLGHVEAVELIDTGTWPASTGPFTPTAQDIASAVAAQDCPAVRRPVLKLGHTGVHGVGGDPALGYVANLRASNEGQTLIGDFRGMPAWLTEVDDQGESVLASAYPDRSIEGTYGYVCQLGHEHPFVVLAVALLGVEQPAIGTLQSLQELYDVTTSTTPSAVAARMEAVMPQPVAAGVTTDDVRRAFYATPEGQPWDVWIREMYVDPPELIVDHDQDASVWRVTYTVSGDDVEFAEGQRVKVEYVAARAQVQAPSVVFASRDEARNVPAASTPTEPSPTPVGEPVAAGDTTTPEVPMTDTLSAGLRQRLGVADDADEATILAALDEALNEQTEPPPAAPTVPDGTVLLDAQQHADLIAAAAQGREARQQQLSEARQRAVDAAVSDGRIPPARRDHWLAQLEADPGAETVLAGLAKGTVPIAAKGEDNAPEGDDALFRSLFPELATQEG